MKFNQRAKGVKISKQNQTEIGMDIAMHVFHRTTINRNSRFVENKHLKRKEMLEYIAISHRRQLPYRLVRVRINRVGTSEAGTHGASVANSEIEPVRAGQHKRRK